ncbi:predicted protein [Uncinocarpus reesii 1704]|uniref:Cyclin-D1-binding protein 1-like N-terminal domain-containing protein n=1 Tax=Uncinocarpus reesii (strain UAMH 1704) TaxID=336963 RepID=C4JH52_UNCRE|nr:uncharacterized protein UREG_02625 [Uncinocarpus reesii 1704]EEP77776.1 predicted protein [Uncinocarpus reesii 1704]
MAARLHMVLETTIALSEQFNLALSSPAAADSTSSAPDHQPSPLPLLSASAQNLKAQTAKLSLLAINTPFTPSALVTVLSNINDSVLPSLVTATLISTPEKYTRTFRREAEALVKDALRELTALVHDIQLIATNYDKKQGFKLSDEEKNEVTIATGRVWSVCDQVVDLVAGGVVGLVIKKAKEYLELIQDGLRELKEWDPEDDLDDDDGLWGDEFGSQDDSGPNRGTLEKSAVIENGDGDEETEDEDSGNQRVKLDEEKKYLLRLFTLTSQLFSAIISYRLKKMDETLILAGSSNRLDALTSCLQDLPSLVDEAAGSLYEHNIEFADAYSLKLRDRASEAAEMLCEPWVQGDMSDTSKQGDAPKGTEDKFSKWAAVFLRVVEDLGKDKEQ